MVLSLDAWIGLVIGTLRPHGINFDKALPLPSGEGDVYGKSMTCGVYTIALGDRRLEEDGREAFFEIQSKEVGLLLRITHRVLVRCGKKVIPRVWLVESEREFRDRFHITPGEVREQGPTLFIIDQVAEHLLAAA